MEITGKLIKKLDVESGVSKTGKEWQKQSILIGQNTEYNKEVAVSFFGDKIKSLRDIIEGDMVSVMINVSSREFKEKYYHNIDGYWISKVSNGVVPSKENEDDLPF
tara:strand:- start:1722 stop:2039 length:318 start_codon:yes stop_codon:yes gene_type:complete